MPGFFDGQLSLKQFFTAGAQSHRTINIVLISLANLNGTYNNKINHPELKTKPCKWR